MTTPDLTKNKTPIKEAASNSRSRAWGMTSLLVLLYIINWSDKAVLGIIAQPLAEELGLSASRIGLVGSLFFLTFTIGGFFAGALNRWMSLRWSIVLLALAWAVAMLPMVVAATFAVLLASRLLLGLAEGPSSALLHTAAYSWHPPAKRALPGALLLGGGSLAKILVGPVLAYVAVAMGWRVALVALAVMGVLWCAVWLPVWSEGPYLGAAHTDDDTEPAPEPAVSWIRIFRTRTFISAALLVMSVYALVSVVLTWLPSYFEVGLGYTRLQAGSMLAFPSIAGLILMVLSSIVGDRSLARGAKSRTVRVITPAVGVLVCGGSLFVVPSIETPAMVVLIISLSYGMAASVFPLLNAAISEICPPRQTAGTMGCFLGVMAIGGLVAPYATGLIVDAANTPAAGYAAAFQALGVVAAACAILALIMANPERDMQIVPRSET